MKKFIKKLSLISLATIGAISVASCGESKPDDTTPSTTESTEPTGSETGSSTDTSTSESEAPVELDHKTVDNGSVTVSAHSTATRYSYSNASYEERTKILGLLEKYAVENNITGLTLYGNGGYVAYSTRIQSGSDNWKYIPGYGYGVLQEGSITRPMDKETNTAWKNYYHSYETDKPATLNYMNSQESVTSDLASLVQGAYFGTCINEEDANAYRWMGDLVEDNDSGNFSDLIEAVGENEEGMAYEFKFKLKDGIKYTTLSSNATLAKYNGTSAAYDDYITPYKLYFSKYIAFVRGNESFGTSSEVAGAQNYYKATQDAKTWDEIDAAWNQYMANSIFVDSEGYLHYKFKDLHTLFYAMYQSSSFMFAPVSKAFLSDLQTVGGYETVADAVKEAWMNSTDKSHGSLTPVDTCLSSGAYAVEQWSDTAIVFKRSNRDDFNDGLYSIEGVHYTILTAAKTDTEAAYKEFLAGSLDAASVPSTKLDEEKGKDYVHMTDDSTTYKINYNVCTKERWAELFGVNGTITKTAESDYWDVKPCMSNSDFLQGLSFALDRKTFAETYGRTPSANYFGNGYYSNPENGTIYNTTDEHKAAVENLINDNTDAYGYSLTLAQEAFTKAAKTLTESDAYKSGDTIKIEVCWQSESQSTTQGVSLKNMFESAFNGSDAHNVYGLTLEVENYACAVWSDVYYKKMMVGQFDLGFGSISGNALNPINFLEVLKSNNSSGFTLNWGPDTNTVDEAMVYDGQAWSFDALWQAADSSALVEGGKQVNYVDTKLEKSTYNSNGTRTTKIKYAAYEGSEIRATFLNSDGTVKDGYIDVTLYNYDGKAIELEEDSYTVTIEDGYIVITTKADVEVDCVQMSVSIYFDVEKKVDESWTVLEEGKNENDNNITITTATKKSN